MVQILHFLMTHQRKSIKKSNPIARLLKRFTPKVIPSKKRYDRKKTKNIQVHD